ncbi:MAG: hypothetical protein KJO35_04540, partial [Gammaproteobacteria bacterium]|nr:hypothetical protein [Gammaproteobacteria bacterium]
MDIESNKTNFDAANEPSGLNSSSSLVNNTLDKYFTAMGRYPLLDRDGEVKLATQIRRGRRRIRLALGSFQPILQKLVDDIDGLLAGDAGLNLLISSNPEKTPTDLKQELAKAADHFRAALNAKRKTARLKKAASEALADVDLVAEYQNTLVSMMRETAGQASDLTRQLTDSLRGLNTDEKSIETLVNSPVKLHKHIREIYKNPDVPADDLLRMHGRLRSLAQATQLKASEIMLLDHQIAVDEIVVRRARNSI